MKASQSDAYSLFHKGSIVLAQMERNGLRIDEKYLRKTIKRVTRELQETEEGLKSDKVWRVWQNVYGQEANLTSRPQLADVLFNKMSLPCTMWTAGGRTGKRGPSTEDKHLKTLNHPFVNFYLEKAKLDKVLNTYLYGIQREVDAEGYLHPVFNLASGSGRDEDKGGARSYRSSCQLPNLQNMPIRNKRFGKLIRRIFISRPGWRLADVDYTGIEVKIAAAYHKDPAMLEYIQDPSKDMHRDMAAECYMLDFAGWDKSLYKDLRYCAKNMFVFPQFYGSVYFQCAPSLWGAIDRMNLRTKDGLSVKEHLATQGIKSLGLCDQKQRPKPGTFEYHIWKAEQDFWGRRFPTYAEWKNNWFQAYQKKGYFDLLTGFRIEGIYRKNEVINLPVQGAAFHCLLWSLIEIQEYLNKHKMQTLIINEVHDSLMLDGPDEEIQDLLPVVKKIMTKNIRKAWKWLIVPLEIECELCPIDGSWAEKEVVKI